MAFDPTKPYELNLAIGTHYLREESGECKISMPVIKDGKRTNNVTSFWMFPMDKRGRKRIVDSGGNPDWNPTKQDNHKIIEKQNTAFLKALFDFDKGWSNFKRINGEDIPYPKGDSESVIEFLTGFAAICSVLRAQSIALAAAMVQGDEKNSDGGSDNEADQDGTLSVS